MKLKTLALLAASAIGVNANALDLNHYYEYQTDNAGFTVLFEHGYYANTSGEVYRDLGSDLELMYDLSDGYLLGTDGITALGYTTTSQSYYLCQLESCNNVSSRTSIPGHIFNSADTYPSILARHTEFTKDGHVLIKSRLQNSEDFTVSVFNMEGQLQDSFTVTPRVYDFTYVNTITYHQMDAVTDITDEMDFKLLGAQHGEYSVYVKQWNSSTKKFQTLPIEFGNGQDINASYENGLAPIAISNPEYRDGVPYYKVAIAILTGNENIISFAKEYSDILIGEITVDAGGAKFHSTPRVVSQPEPRFVYHLTTNEAVFFEGDILHYPGYDLDFVNSSVTNSLVTKDDRSFYASVYFRSDNGAKVVIDNTNSSTKYKIFAFSSLGLVSSSNDIDPYVDPVFTVDLSAFAGSYYGIEANCSLQSTNATVDSNNYIDLSGTALQIPIEWDAVTGEWKGAQSLTGLESLSGTKDFAQFNLTADVTTGTWTMNCSGIASDIEGNKIELNPAEITINLDDQIHGGSSVISGQIQIPNTTDYSGVVVTITLNGRQIEATTMEDGSFEFDRLVEGDYTVHVYSEQYVAACNNLTLDGTSAAAPLTIEMYAGDINNDGAVDIGDFSYLSSLYGLGSTDEQYDALADLNHDGIINVQDLSILGSHFGTDHCEVAPE